MSDPADKYIKLDQFLKLQGLAQSGGEAKFFITSGEVSVNGESETRRGRKLRHGDTVQFAGQDFAIEFED